MKHRKLCHTTQISAIGKKEKIILLALLLMVCTIQSCKKFVEVNSLKDQLLAGQVFSTDATANSAVAGIYTQAKGLMIDFAVNGGLASDDLVDYTSSLSFQNYQHNTIPANDGALPWSQLYSVIYSANAAIEGLSGNTSVSQKAKAYYTGEAEFLRAYSYFYLVNLFGDVPLIVSTDVTKSAIAPRADAHDVYTQIIADLIDAQNKLGTDYSYTGGDKTRADKWVATALLARVYLYQKDWKDAEAQATAVINSGQYSLLDNPNGIFLADNNEAILQWARFNGEVNSLPSFFIFSNSPQTVCSDFLLNAFEPGDLRKTTWLMSGVYLNNTIYYPFKFTTTSTSTTEDYTVLRLAEQYLIRAEARVMQNNVSNGLSDLNLVRQKHGGLPGLSNLNQQNSLTAIMHERQVDLFTEEMQRFFDLKRTGKIDSVMMAEKPATWKSTAALYPIPLSDIQRDPNLTQNPGY